MHSWRTFGSPISFTKATTGLDPRLIEDGGSGAELAIAALAPGIARVPAPQQGDDGRYSLLLVESEPSGGAWAAVDCEPGLTEFTVTWHGRRNLWHEVSDAYRKWVSWGEPDHRRFGLTVTPDGQYVWLDHPRHALSRGSRPL